MGYIVPGEGQLENLYVDDPWLFEKFSGDRLWTCGYNNHGQLGDNTRTNRSSPVQTVTGGTNWMMVSAGGYTIGEGFVSAIKTDGTLWSWGQGSSGQLGDNTAVKKSSPVQTVAGGTNWKQVSAGQSHCAAVKTDGTLWLWGLNTLGQLGNNGVVAMVSPTQTTSFGTDWKQVSAGGAHSAAIKTDGTLWSWGRGDSGQLGDNTSVHKSSPVQVIGGGTNWGQVSCGTLYTAAIKTDGTLWLWGNNAWGQLGDNTTVNKSSPVQTVSGGTNWKQVAGGLFHTAAIKTDGTLWTWGGSNSGCLGDNANTHRSSPVQTVTGGTNWKQVACGYYNTAAIKTDGTLWAWGRDSYGQLGDNTTVNKSSPVQTVAGGTNWKQVSVCNNVMAAISINNINTTGVE